MMWVERKRVGPCWCCGGCFERGPWRSHAFWMASLEMILAILSVHETRNLWRLLSSLTCKLRNPLSDSAGEFLVRTGSIIISSSQAPWDCAAAAAAVTDQGRAAIILLTGLYTETTVVPSPLLDFAPSDAAEEKLWDLPCCWNHNDGSCMGRRRRQSAFGWRAATRSRCRFFGGEEPQQ